VGRLRGRIRHPEHEVETGYVTLEHEDGMVPKWPLGDEGFNEMLLHEYERGGPTLRR
jgi:hypothetical protein